MVLHTPEWVKIRGGYPPLTYPLIRGGYLTSRENPSSESLFGEFSTFQASAQTLTGRKSFVIEAASAQDFGGSTAKFSPRFGGHRFAFAQDDFWTSTRKPCGLTTAKLSAGSGGHPFSSPNMQIPSIWRTTTCSSKQK